NGASDLRAIAIVWAVAASMTIGDSTITHGVTNAANTAAIGRHASHASAYCHSPSEARPPPSPNNHDVATAPKTRPIRIPELHHSVNAVTMPQVVEFPPIGQERTAPAALVPV